MQLGKGLIMQFAQRIVRVEPQDWARWSPDQYLAFLGIFGTPMRVYIVYLIACRGCTASEIAACLGCDVTTVAKLLPELSPILISANKTGTNAHHLAFDMRDVSRIVPSFLLWLQASLYGTHSANNEHS